MAKSRSQKHKQLVARKTRVINLFCDDLIHDLANDDRVGLIQFDHQFHDIEFMRKYMTDILKFTKQ